MTVRMLVACDSRPAPYAGGDSWPCRAYLPTRAHTVGDALVEALRAGWQYEYHETDGHIVTDRVTCPACVRAYAALAQARP